MLDLTLPHLTSTVPAWVQVYKISMGSLKQANRQFNQCKSDFEITFGRDTNFELLSDADAPKVHFDFRSIEQIEQMSPGDYVDVLAICQVTRACRTGSCV